MANEDITRRDLDAGFQPVSDETPWDDGFAPARDQWGRPVEADAADMAGEAGAGEGTVPFVDDPESSGFLALDAREFDLSKRAGLDEDEAQGAAEVGQSFSALKDSISQGRELKAREKERDELQAQIDAGREELTDRDNILANYASIVAEQDAIIAQNAQAREDARYEFEATSTRMGQAEDVLAQMQAAHAQQLQPLETALGRATATAQQAKNDERSRKSELSAVDTELRRAEEGQAEIAQAKRQIIAGAYEEAKRRLEAARDAEQQAQKAYDAARKRFDGEEAPVIKDIDAMQARCDQLKAEIEQLDATLQQMQERRQYCEDVYRNPDETEQLRASIASDLSVLQQMDQRNDELRVQLEATKGKARTAKFALIGIVAIIIIVIIAIVGIRSCSSGDEASEGAAGAAAGAATEQVESAEGAAEGAEGAAAEGAAAEGAEGAAEDAAAEGAAEGAEGAQA